MDDILLSDLKILDIIEKARKQCDADGKPKSHYQAYECHALCRAQMAKVETEHERITAEGFCPYGDQCKTHYYSCIRCQDEYFWQALRVAAGMEGGE